MKVHDTRDLRLTVLQNLTEWFYIWKMSTFHYAWRQKLAYKMYQQNFDVKRFQKYFFFLWNITKLFWGVLLVLNINLQIFLSACWSNVLRVKRLNGGAKVPLWEYVTFYRKWSSFQNVWRKSSGTKCTWYFDVKCFEKYSFSYRTSHMFTTLISNNTCDDPQSKGSFQHIDLKVQVTRNTWTLTFNFLKISFFPWIFTNV